MNSSAHATFCDVWKPCQPRMVHLIDSISYLTVFRCPAARSLRNSENASNLKHVKTIASDRHLRSLYHSSSSARRSFFWELHVISRWQHRPPPRSELGTRAYE